MSSCFLHCVKEYVMSQHNCHTEFEFWMRVMYIINGPLFRSVCVCVCLCPQTHCIWQKTNFVLLLWFQLRSSECVSLSVASDSLWPIDCSSSVQGIIQARPLEWVPILFSRGSSQPRDKTQVSWIAGRFLTVYYQGSPTEVKEKPNHLTASDLRCLPLTRRALLGVHSFLPPLKWCIYLFRSPLGFLPHRSPEICTIVSKDIVSIHLKYGDNVLIRI